MPRTTDNAPALDGIDHIHVFVTDRSAAEVWYARVLGLSRVLRLEGWAADGGPLTLADASGRIHLALFERGAQACRSTIALGTSAAGFMAWRAHLAVTLGKAARTEDHQLSWSMYFADPDGNPYEITSYEYDVVGALLAAQGA
jgi:catechol 2,3-dioxygenase-like lactoylglutathione lyase family enzyme